jgi:hypothetical protein
MKLFTVEYICVLYPPSCIERSLEVHPTNRCRCRWDESEGNEGVRMEMRDIYDLLNLIGNL